MTNLTLSSQRGSSLVMTLIVLGVLMLMGGTAVMVANTQFKIAGNLQFQSLAMSDAESALATAENWLPANYANAGFAELVTPGLYPINSGVNPTTMAWTDATSIKGDPAGNQRYAIELYIAQRPLPSNSVATCGSYGSPGACAYVNVYRVTARGVSRNGATRIVQSLFAVRTN